MKLIPVESKMLESAGYDADDEKLRIVFRNGSTYEYSGVEEAIYQDLLNATSKGAFFLEYIREIYEGKRL